jgi:acetate kinase
MSRTVLVFNAGSSTLKFALFDLQPEGPSRRVGGSFDMGQGKHHDGDRVKLLQCDGSSRSLMVAEPGSLASAFVTVLAWCQGDPSIGTIDMIGHRIVHGGMKLGAPTLLTAEVLHELAALEPLAPLHQPYNLAGVEMARQAFPAAIHYGCFDTAFHSNKPFSSDIYGLPLSFYDQGIRRFGFHGLSCEHVAAVLAQEEPDLAKGRVIVAHLGNGASLCALLAGRSLGSSMGFSPLDGLPMGTRCGQIDPGVLLYLMQAHGMDAGSLAKLLYHDAGLKGMSGISSDMRVLLASKEPDAALAVDYFIDRTRRELGGLCTVLGGLDGLVFTGGIGENATVIRQRICQGLEWLGVRLDVDANDAGARQISAAGSNVKLLIIPSDEESVMARAGAAFVP